MCGRLNIEGTVIEKNVYLNSSEMKFGVEKEN